MLYKWLVALAVLATLLGIGHHIDHIVRGNHVGWPLTETVTPFTFSLGFYLPVLTGLYLSRMDKVGPRFWAIVAGFGILFVGLTHFGPVAVEPPSDIINQYELPVIGWAAFGLLVAFLAVLAFAVLYAAYLYAVSNRRKSA